MAVSNSTRTESVRRIVVGGLAAVCVMGAGCSSDAPVEAIPRCVIPVGESPTRGPADAWVTIVEFADFECSYCGKAQAIIRDVDAARPGLRWVFKHFPLSSVHPHAISAAVAAECARAQGQFWEMHDALYLHQASLGEASLVRYATDLGLDLDAWNACRASEAIIDPIQRDFTLGLNVGVSGTPTFFVNGAALPGAYPAGDFIALIDAAEAAALASKVAATDYYTSIEVGGCESL